MLVKRSVKNQIAIPKAVLERAGLSARDVYFDVEYRNGHIILTPMELEEKISPEALRRFKERSLKQEAGDKTYHSMDEALRGLRHSHKTR